MTLSKSIVMLSVGALIVTCYASSADISYSDFMDHLYRETMEYKRKVYNDAKRVPRCRGVDCFRLFTIPFADSTVFFFLFF